MSTTGMTFEEMSESLTGFDEIAIEKAFSFDVYADSERKPILAMRALVFVHLRRGNGVAPGLSDADAKQRVMDMPVSEVQDYFDEQDADKHVGEGEGEPETQPTGSPTSASSPE